MWALHIVVVRGGTGWPAALTFGLVACLSGWLFAALSGERASEPALTLDLLLGAAGAALGQLAAPSDPLATIFGVHLFAAAFGAALLLGLAHDLAAIERPPARVRLLLTPLSPRGGLCCTFLGLTAWQHAVPPLALYANGLRVAQVDDALWYEVRLGPLRGARRLALPPDATLLWTTAALQVRSPGQPAPLLVLPNATRCTVAIGDEATPAPPAPCPSGEGTGFPHGSQG